MRRRLRKHYHNLKYGVLKWPRFAVQPTDCFIISFPRSGSTWMHHMISYAMEPDHNWTLLEILDRIPIITRRDFREHLRQLKALPQRIFKAHEPFRPYLLQGRIVYIVRDGRDATMSFHHYDQNMKGLDVSFSKYLKQSLRGKYRYGSWHNHVSGWWAKRSHPSLLIIRYEHMLKDPAQELRRALHHFGIEVPDENISLAVEHSSIDQVSKGFTLHAVNRSKTFSGGTGGGTEKWKQKFREQDKVLFIKYAGNMLQEIGYEI